VGWQAALTDKAALAEEEAAIVYESEIVRGMPVGQGKEQASCKLAADIAHAGRLREEAGSFLRAAVSDAEDMRRKYVPSISPEYPASLVNCVSFAR